MADKFPVELESLEEKRLATRRMKWVITGLLFLTMVGLTAGVYAAMVGHDYAYGVYREIPWGILMAGFAFFGLTATGLCLISALGHAYGVTPLAPLGMRAMYLAIVTVITAFMLFAMSIEDPWRLLLYNAASPSLTSNIWWMTTLYGIMSGALFLKFSFLVTNRYGWAVSFGILSAVTAVGANNNLGGLFTLAADPPIWYGYQLLILFLTAAVLSGAAAIIVFTVLAFRIRRQRIPSGTMDAMHAAGTILALALAITLVVYVSRFSSMLWGDTTEPGVVAAMALLKGPLAVNFWLLEIGAGLVGPLVLLGVTRIKNVRVMTVAASLALVGSFSQRYDLVIGGQLVPKFPGWNNLPQYLSYMPTFTEMLVLLGAVALSGAGFLLGERFIGRIFRVLA